MNELDQKLLGARILSEANDLKRTLPAMAKDLGISESSLKEAVQGKCSIDDQIHLVKKMGEKYPIDSNELLLPEDDCTYH